MLPGILASLIAALMYDEHTKLMKTLASAEEIIRLLERLATHKQRVWKVPLRDPKYPKCNPEGYAIFSKKPGDWDNYTLLFYEGGLNAWGIERAHPGKHLTRIWIRVTERGIQGPSISYNAEEFRHWCERERLAYIEKNSAGSAYA